MFRYVMIGINQHDMGKAERYEKRNKVLHLVIIL